MVKKLAQYLLGAALCLPLFGSNYAYGIFAQTQDDLDVLADALETELGVDSNLRRQALPLLFPQPLHHWKESRKDFAAAATRIVVRTFKERGQVVDCPECDTWRLQVRDDHKVQMNNGPLSITELSRLTSSVKYKKAKSVLFIKETPGGVEAKLVSLADGQILFYRLADSTETLDDVRPFMNYARERDRRLRGESLSYVWLNLGVYPNALFQLEYVEQWGAWNQHISGVGISLFNPTLALGAIYHYMFPRWRKLHASVALYYPLQAAVESAVGSGDFASGFVPQAGIHYTFASSYGFFLIANTETVSFGFNFFNPLFLPFVL